MGKVLEQVAGAALMLLVLADVFLTVFYARMETGIISTRLARLTWYAFRAFSNRVQAGRRGKLLSLCGPTILVTVVLVWGFTLTLGAALVVQPYLDNSIQASNGETSTNFTTAMFVGGKHRDSGRQQL